MDAMLTYGTTLALFNLSGGEIILVVALIMILWGTKRLPDLGRGLGMGIDEFRKATREVTDEINQGSFDAGQSVGGIYGRPAAEALTPDNQVAELYDPSVFEEKKCTEATKQPSHRVAGSAVRLFMLWLIRKLRVGPR